MIERKEVDGKPATVEYMDKDYKPCKKEVAVKIRVRFENGSTKLLNAK